MPNQQKRRPRVRGYGACMTTQLFLFSPGKRRRLIWTFNPPQYLSDLGSIFRRERFLQESRPVFHLFVTSGSGGLTANSEAATLGGELNVPGPSRGVLGYRLPSEPLAATESSSARPKARLAPFELGFRPTSRRLKGSLNRYSRNRSRPSNVAKRNGPGSLIATSG